MGRLGDILADLKGRRILVVGMARSGLASARVLANREARVTGTDRKDSFEGRDDLEQVGVRLELGGDRIDLVEDSDLVVLSPGVPMSAPIPAEAARRGVPLVGEMEMAFRLLLSDRRPDVVAVTGTNGKSTTAALCSHLLGRGEKKVFLGGNIGRPMAELLLGEDAVDRVVVEVSSFQLEHLTRPGVFIPQVGIWLNLTPDHLDRHGDMKTYAGMKRRLFEGQGQDELGVFFLDDPALEEFLSGLPCRRSGFSRLPERLVPGGILIEGRQLRLPESSRGVTLQLNSPRLAGDHNAENAAAAVLAALALGEDLDRIQAGLDSYPGLPHRLEPIRELDGVQYVNDSKGTNVDATAKSLTSFDTPVILLAGGRGKGTGYKKLCPLVSKHVKHLILLGEEAEQLARDLDGCAPVHRVTSMDEAVAKARSLAGPGDVVLLSPACASFDMFSDYAQRGRVFADRVRDLGGQS